MFQRFGGVARRSLPGLRCRELRLTDEERPLSTVPLDELKSRFKFRIARERREGETLEFRWNCRNYEYRKNCGMADVKVKEADASKSFTERNTSNGKKLVELSRQEFYSYREHPKIA